MLNFVLVVQLYYYPQELNDSWYVKYVSRYTVAISLYTKDNSYMHQPLVQDKFFPLHRPYVAMPPIVHTTCLALSIRSGLQLH